MAANYRTQTASGGATKGVTWGQGGGSSYIFLTPGSPTTGTFVASGGGGAGLTEPGKSAVAQLAKTCGITDGFNPGVSNGQSTSGGGGGGCAKGAAGQA